MAERHTHASELEAPGADRGLELYGYLRTPRDAVLPDAPRAKNRSRGPSAGGAPADGKLKITDTSVGLESGGYGGEASNRTGPGASVKLPIGRAEHLLFDLTPEGAAVSARFGEMSGAGLRGGLKMEVRGEGDVSLEPCTDARGRLLLQRVWRTRAQVSGDADAGPAVRAMVEAFASLERDVRLTTPVEVDEVNARLDALRVTRVDEVPGVDGRFLRGARAGFAEVDLLQRLGLGSQAVAALERGAPWEALTSADLASMGPGERWVFEQSLLHGGEVGLGASARVTAAMSWGRHAASRTGVVIARPEQGAGVDVLRLDTDGGGDAFGAGVAYGGGVEAASATEHASGAGRFVRVDPHHVQLANVIEGLAGDRAALGAQRRGAVVAGGHLKTLAQQRQTALGVQARTGDMLGVRGEGAQRVGHVDVDVDLTLMGAHSSDVWTEDLVQVFADGAYAARLDTSAANATQSKLMWMTLAERREWAAAGVHHAEGGQVSLRLDTEQSTAGVVPSEQGLEAMGLSLGDVDIALIAQRASDPRWPEVILRMTTSFQPVAAARAHGAWRGLGAALTKGQAGGGVCEPRAQLAEAARMAEAVREGGPAVGMALVQVARGLRDEARLGEVEEWPPDLAEERERIEGLEGRVAALPALLSLGGQARAVASELVEEIEALRERVVAASFTNPVPRRDLLLHLGGLAVEARGLCDAPSFANALELAWWLGELERFKAMERDTLVALRREIKVGFGRWFRPSRIACVCEAWGQALPHWWAAVDVVRQRYDALGVPDSVWRVVPSPGGRRGLEPDVPRVLRLLGDVSLSDRRVAGRVAERARRYRHG